MKNLPTQSEVRAEVREFLADCRQKTDQELYETLLKFLDSDHELVKLVCQVLQIEGAAP